MANLDHYVIRGGVKGHERLKVVCRVIYARFLLSHLSDPATVLNCLHHLLKPGGKLVVEDIDFVVTSFTLRSRPLVRFTPPKSEGAEAMFLFDRFDGSGKPLFSSSSKKLHSRLTKKFLRNDRYR